MKQRGFTIVELLIVLIVTSILLTLAAVNLQGSRARAHDAERKSDVEAIATILESFYNGTHTAPGHATPVYSKTYPSRNDIPSAGYDGSLTSLTNTQRAAVTYIEERAGRGILHGPNADQEGRWSLRGATGTGLTIATVTPQPTEDTYVYQAISNKSGADTVCNTTSDHCSSFRIFYYSESPEGPDCQGNICMLRSKR